MLSFIRSLGNYHCLTASCMPEPVLDAENSLLYTINISVIISELSRERRQLISKLVRISTLIFSVFEVL